MKRVLLSLLAVLLTAGVRAEGRVYEATALGIVGDGLTLNTECLQQAVDRIAAEGGTLRFTPGRYLTGSIMLRSGITIQIDEGATLLGSTNPYDYQGPLPASPRGGRGIATTGSTADSRHDNAAMALLMADGAEGITLTGRGCIDGQGLELALAADSLHHTGERPDPHYNVHRQRPSELVRPKLFFFSNSRDITVDSLHLRSSANWGLSFDLCERLTLRHLDIENRAYWNNDGIDLTDCRHVTVSDCRINAADDGICLKSYHADSECYDISITRCHIRSSASAVKMGTASWGGFRRVHVSDITVLDTFRSAIAIESVDGGAIDSILVERIDARNTGNPLFLRLGRRAGDRQGSLRNVTLRDITCEVPFGRPDEAYDLRGPEVDFLHNPFPSPICGLPDNPIENVTLERIAISCPGRATRGMAYLPLWRLGDVPEQAAKYPEFSMFGELPAWGLYVRHVRGITLRDVTLTLRDADFRPAIVFDDVTGVNQPVPGAGE